ncbi:MULTISPECIES: response regulator [unclassified Modestobacter]
MTTTAVAFSDVNDLVDALAWPLVVLILVLVFRRPLSDLLSRDHVEATLPGGLSFVARDPQAATDALVGASAGKGMDVDEASAQREIEAATTDLVSFRRRPRLLWVDERPSDNRCEVQAFEALGFSVELATSTAEGVAKVALHGPFDAIISDMGRPADARGGYTLLDSLRQAGDATPYVIYSGSDRPEHYDEAVRHGAVGSTNNPAELIRLVRRAIRSTATSPPAPRSRNESASRHPDHRGP